MNESVIQQAASAIRELRRAIRWKPGKAAQHLAKRKVRRHLPEAATLDDYNATIRALLAGQENAVYYYPFGGQNYYAVSGSSEGTPWLVIFSSDGILETAFPPRDLRGYVERRGFVTLGRIKELADE